MRRLNLIAAGLIASISLFMLGSCGGGGGGVVTGTPVPTPPIDDPFDDDWIIDDYDDYYDGIYGDLYDPMARLTSRSIVNPVSYAQRLELNRRLNVDGYNWRYEYPELHIPMTLGEHSISSGQYLLASYNAVDVEAPAGSFIQLTPPYREAAYAIYALEGMQAGWQVDRVGLESEWYDPDDYQDGEMWLGISRDTAEGLQFSWSGPFYSTDVPRDSYLHGFDNTVADDKVYICVLLTGEADLDISALRVGIRDYQE